jgi:hypothetical protein
VSDLSGGETPMTITARLLDADDSTELLRFGDTEALVIQTLNLGWPDVRESVSLLPGRDGTTDTTSRRGAMAITATIAVRDTAEASRDVWLTRLRGYLSPARRCWLRLSRDGWAGERRVLVRGAQAPATFEWGFYSVPVGWVAPDGVLESAVEQAVTLYPAVSDSGGVTYPITHPFSFDPGNVPAASFVVNGGTVDALPYVDIYGACGNAGVLKNLTYGEQVAFTSLPIGAGDFLRVDMKTRQVLLSNDIAQSRYSNVDFTSSTWWALRPGSQLVAFVPVTPGVACSAILRWRDTTI